MENKYEPDFFTAMGRIGGIDWRGDTEALKRLGVSTNKIKESCQKRLEEMFSRRIKWVGRTIQNIK